MNALLTIQKVVLLFIGSVLLALGVFWLGERFNAFWRVVLISAFFGGHCFLAVRVVKNRLIVAFPITRHWGDVFAVIGACWLGPAVWFCAWRNAQRGEPVIAASEWPTISKRRLIWLLFLIVVLCIELVWFRIAIINSP